jgi:hypothetical protein
MAASLRLFMTRRSENNQQKDSIVFASATEKCNTDEKEMRWGHIMETNNLENYMTSFATSRQASLQYRL